MCQERQTKRFLTTRLVMLGSVAAASSVLPSMEWKRVLPRGQQSTRRIPEKVTTPHRISWDWAAEPNPISSQEQTTGLLMDRSVLAQPKCMRQAGERPRSSGEHQL